MMSGRPEGEPAAPAAPPDFFDADYRRLLAPFHPEEDARRETAALREILALAQDDRILDLGCGWGRHLSLLAHAGHDVTGLDLSPALLAEVPRLPPGVPEGRDPRGAAARVPPVVAADIRAIPLADGSFDVVLNLATSLGLFLSDDAAALALREARRVLRPGGRLLLEGMHREDVEAGFAPRVRWFLADGTEVRARRRWDAARAISEEVLRWRGPAGAGEKRHTLRIRAASETAALVERAGLTVAEVLGDWDGSEWDRTSPRVILVARR